jgi:hypothetical protein
LKEKTMSNTLKEKITLLSEAELAELTLRETLSVEEALCDASDPAFLIETADLPVDLKDLKDCKECKGVGEFDKYQFFNQDQIAGITNSDLYNLYDPDSQDSYTTEGDKDLNEAMIPGGPGTLNNDFIIRNAADITNPDLSVQFTEIPSDFDEILTAGSVLRRAADTQHARAAGVPIQIEDLLKSSKIVASNLADEVNGKQDVSHQYGVETIVAHPIGTDQNQTLKEGVNGMVSFLIGESADNTYADTAGPMPDDDDGDDDLNNDDLGSDDLDSDDLDSDDLDSDDLDSDDLDSDDLDSDDLDSDDDDSDLSGDLDDGSSD